MNKNVIVITGPTASGKTDFALNLSDFAEIEIISADSRQIYRYMDIGTAKPTKTQLEKVKHHFIDSYNPDENFSAGRFAEEAVLIINKIISKGKIPVVAGGTGFYIKALFEGLSEIDSLDNDQSKKVRNELINLLKVKGKDYLYDILINADPESANKYNDKNPRRVMRALEYYYINNQKFSDTFNNQVHSEFKPIYYVLNPNREELYQKINKRTEKMYADGLIKETVDLLEKGYSFEMNSLNTVGYKECIELILGRATLEQAINLTKQNTRHYAKRQVTWFNQIKDINFTNGSSRQVYLEILKKYNSTNQ